MTAPLEPMPLPPAYDPERWARKWGSLGASLLAIGSVLGVWIPHGSFYLGPPTAWGSLDRDLLAKAILDGLVPVVAAILAAVACARWRGTRLAIAVVSAGALTVVEPVVADSVILRWEDSGLSTLALLRVFGWFRIAALTAGIAISTRQISAQSQKRHLSRSDGFTSICPARISCTIRSVVWRDVSSQFSGNSAASQPTGCTPPFNPM